MKIKINFPPTHSQGDVEKLLNEYRATYPDEYREWLKIERKGKDIEIGELFDIHKHVDAFLQERTISDSHMARDEVFMHFRTLIVRGRELQSFPGEGSKSQ